LNDGADRVRRHVSERAKGQAPIEALRGKKKKEKDDQRREQKKTRRSGLRKESARSNLWKDPERENRAGRKFLVRGREKSRKGEFSEGGGGSWAGQKKKSPASKERGKVIRGWPQFHIEGKEYLLNGRNRGSLSSRSAQEGG